MIMIVADYNELAKASSICEAWFHAQVLVMIVPWGVVNQRLNNLMYERGFLKLRDEEIDGEHIVDSAIDGIVI